MDTLLQIFLILALMAPGALARWRGLIGEEGTAEMARILIAILYPALILDSITRLSLRYLLQNWSLPVLTLTIAGIGLALGLLTLRRLKPTGPDRAGAFLFQSTINNYLFLPLPLVMLRWGSEGVALLVFASIGFELTIWTVGVLLFNRDARRGNGVRMMFGPPLIALTVSIIWIVMRDLFSLSLPEVSPLHRLPYLLEFGVSTIGRATVAVSMLVAGSRIATLHPGAIHDRQVWIVSTLRLVVIPVVFILLLNRLPLEETARGVLTVVAVMPAAVASLVFSERYSGDSEFIAASLLLTHLGAIVTVPLLLLWAL